jgi:hypothetical protein
MFSIGSDRVIRRCLLTVRFGPLFGLRAGHLPRSEKCRSGLSVLVSMDRAVSPWIGIGGSLSAPPLPHHRTYGSYTAVREVALTHFDQGGETERFEVGIGEPY